MDDFNFPSIGTVAFILQDNNLKVLATLESGTPFIQCSLSLLGVFVKKKTNKNSHKDMITQCQDVVLAMTSLLKETTHLQKCASHFSFT